MNTPQKPQTDPVRRLEARELFAGARQVEIRHDGRTYLLRLTANGKLILTA
jgi:hemin uptake protein HemP